MVKKKVEKREGITMAKKKDDKIVVKSRKIKGKHVTATLNGEPIANVIKFVRGKGKGEVKGFVTTNPRSDNPGASIRAHRTEKNALSRYRRFPQITRRVGKLL